MQLIPWSDILTATFETIYIVILSTTLSALLGLPLGMLLFYTEKLNPKPIFHLCLSYYVNICRAIPFIILMVALIPFTRFIVGTSIGINAAIVPLVFGATPFLGRLIHNQLSQLPDGLIETGCALGASTVQMFKYILIPEALSSIIQSITITAIALVNYSAMAGTVGGGGLGDLAIRYGYQRFDMTVMLVTIVILVLLVQLIQTIGDYLSQR
jgi:D-methionine transport system permease protein